MEDRSTITNVGRSISRRRKQKGLTQAQVAEQMRVEKETVSRIETGVISPTLKRLDQLAEILSCSVTDLIRYSDHRPDDHVIGIAEIMQDLNEEERQLVVDLVAQVANVLNARDGSRDEHRTSGLERSSSYRG